MADYETQDLGTFGGTGCEAYGINDRAQLVGRRLFDGNGWRAFLYDFAQGEFINLGTLGGTSFAEAINQSGDVVGTSTTGRDLEHFYTGTASCRTSTTLWRLIRAGSYWTPPPSTIAARLPERAALET